MNRLLADLSILHLAGGGCGGCGLELMALQRSRAALAEAGLRFVDSPRHAELLLVSGTATRTLLPAIEAAWAAMPAPRWLVLVGACAADDGPFRGAYAVDGGLAARLPVSLTIPGCPPDPDAILAALMRLLVSEPADDDAPGLSPAPQRREPDPPARPPAAPPHPRAGDDSSAG